MTVDTPSSHSYILPKKVLPYFAFMPLPLDLVQVFRNLCWVLWVTLWCLLCAVSCKSSSLLSCLLLRFYVCFFYNPWLFCHQAKPRIRTYLFFSVLVFQCENSSAFPPSLHSRMLLFCFRSMVCPYTLPVFSLVLNWTLVGSDTSVSFQCSLLQSSVWCPFYHSDQICF